MAGSWQNGDYHLPLRVNAETDYYRSTHCCGSRCIAHRKHLVKRRRIPQPAHRAEQGNAQARHPLCTEYGCNGETGVKAKESKRKKLNIITI